MTRIKNIVLDILQDTVEFTGSERKLICFLMDQIDDDDERITGSFSVPFEEIGVFLRKERVLEEELQSLLESTIEKMLRLRMKVDWGFVKIEINLMSSALCDMTERKVFFRFNQDILDPKKYISQK